MAHSGIPTPPPWLGKQRHVGPPEQDLVSIHANLRPRAAWVIVEDFASPLPAAVTVPKHLRWCLLTISYSFFLVNILTAKRLIIFFLISKLTNFMK
jgi:hypothetical protein